MKIYDTANATAKWWADRLHPQHADKRDNFFEDLARRVALELELRGQVFLENDYDPHGILLDAVQATINPNCSGMGFSGRGIFPDKHETMVTIGKIEPKEGYGNWTDEILL